MVAIAAPVPVFDIFGFMRGENETLDINRRGIPLWRLRDVVDYFTQRGYDGILIERVDETWFERGFRDPVPMLAEGE